ncbi:hypothetical protein AB0F88_02685 [Streptosporangium sp. NPDC023963]|uniref:hypothetical protein n=1 Tax=Streptosporangium sp. NPDC023963 TaxID=3155608 RepID=UPI003414F86C
MIHTEDELRAALAEDVCDTPPDVREIVRRGRRIRRRRAVAGVALAGAAAVAVALVGQGFWRSAQPVEEPPTAARISPPPPALPPEDLLDAPLITSYGFTTMPGSTTVTFQPLSAFTTYLVVCADPKAVVVIRKHNGGGTAGTCGKDGFYNYNHDRTVSLERPQRLKIWVLPGDALIDPPGPHPNPYEGCKVVRKEVGLCDGKYMVSALLRPGVVERVSAGIERRPGRWAVGVYDQADRTAPPGPTPTRTVTVEPDDRAGAATRPGPTPTRTVTVGP